jgi:hypothetical protein
MKTTIELPDDLLVAAKKRAAELRCSVKQLVEEGLRLRLSPRNGKQPTRRKKIRWVTGKGGLPPGVDVSDRESLHDWIQRQA